MNPNTVSFTTIASSIRRLSLAAILVSSLATPSWGKGEKVDIVEARPDLEDNVTIRVKVNDRNGNPILTLKKTDFDVIDSSTDKPLADSEFNWQLLKDAKSPPAYIVVLVDMSGSMNEPDPKGQKKLDAAIAAIQSFLKQAQPMGDRVKVAIVPFGKSSASCSEGYSVTTTELDKFSSVNSATLTTYLDNLGNEKPCASTNLYEALTATVNYLADPDRKKFHPTDFNVLQPRLWAILLSDGFDTEGGRDTASDAIDKHKKEIVVHTLGYGYTPEGLQEKYKLSEVPTEKDVYWQKKDESPPPGKVPADEYVDKDGLAELARKGGGKAEFAGNAQEIGRSLKLILDSLSEYEITYPHPQPERGEKYRAQVTVRGASDSENYRLTVYGRPLEPTTRLMMLPGIACAFGLLGLLPFWLWGKWLKRQAEDH